MRLDNMQGGNNRERRAPSRPPHGAGEYVRDQLYQAHGGRIGSESSHTGDTRIVRTTTLKQHERCDKFTSREEGYGRNPRFDRGRSPSRDSSREQERYKDRSLSRSRDPIHYDRRHAHQQTHWLSSGEEYRRSNGRESLSPYRSSDFERSRGRRSDRENGYRDEWEPGERSRNWEEPNRDWNTSSSSNHDSWEKDYDDGHRSRQRNFDTRSQDRRRPCLPPSRNNSYSLYRFRNYGIEDEGNMYSSDEELKFPRHMQDHFTYDDPGSGRDTEKYYYARESDEFEDEFRYYNRNQSYRSPKSDRNSDTYERPDMNLTYESDNFVPVSFLKLCTNSGSKSPESCDCDALHICKYFLLSKCLVPNCSFGHEIYTEHNESILKNYFRQRPTIQQVKFEICKIENRNESTVPQICKFYNNEGGCKYEKQNNAKKCPCLHICKYYVQKNCKFEQNCKRSHGLFFDQTSQILRSYGLQPRNESHYAEILVLLGKIAVFYADKNAPRQSNDIKKWMKGNIKNLTSGQSRSVPENRITNNTNNSDFIPFTFPRYFNFKDDSANDDDDFASEESLMLAKPRHGKKNKRKHRDDNKMSKRKRKKSRGQVNTNVNLAAATLMGNPDTNDSMLDAKLGTNENGADAQIGRNDSRPDANFGANNSGPDANLGTNDSGPSTNPGTNDSMPDINLGTNDCGPAADLGDNDRCSALQTVGGQMDG